MVTPANVLSGAVAYRVLTRDMQDSARRRGEVDREVSGERPRDPLLDEYVRQLESASSREEFELAAAKVEERAGQVGREIGRRNPQRILGFRVPVLSAALGASSGEARALAAAGRTIRDVDERTMKSLEAMQAEHLRCMRDDFARADELRRLGRTAEAEELEKRAKEDLRHVAEKAQKAYGADKVGDGDMAGKQAHYMLLHVGHDIRTHKREAERMKAREMAAIATSPEALGDLEQVEIGLANLAETPTPRGQLTERERQLQVAPAVVPHKEELTVAPNASGRLRALTGTLEGQAAIAQHDASLATVEGQVIVAPEAAANVEAARVLKTGLEDERRAASARGEALEKEVAALRESMKDGTLTKDEVLAAANAVKEEHSEVLGGKKPEEVVKEAASDSNSITRGWLALEIERRRESAAAERLIKGRRGGADQIEEKAA